MVWGIITNEQRTERGSPNKPWGFLERRKSGWMDRKMRAYMDACTDQWASWTIDATPIQLRLFSSSLPFCETRGMEAWSSSHVPWSHLCKDILSPLFSLLLTFLAACTLDNWSFKSRLKIPSITCALICVPMWLLRHLSYFRMFDA